MIFSQFPQNTYDDFYLVLCNDASPGCPTGTHSYIFKKNQLRSENANTTMPSITSTIPVARFKVFADALFAKTAAILAQRSVNAIHKSSTNQSGFPPMAKCEAAPVKAVNAMINTLVPTAVLSS